MAGTQLLNSIWRVWVARQCLLFPQNLCTVGNHFALTSCSTQLTHRLHATAGFWKTLHVVPFMVRAVSVVEELTVPVVGCFSPCGIDRHWLWETCSERLLMSGPRAGKACSIMHLVKDRGKSSEIEEGSVESQQVVELPPPHSKNVEAWEDSTGLSSSSSDQKKVSSADGSGEGLAQGSLPKGPNTSSSSFSPLVRTQEGPEGTPKRSLKEVVQDVEGLRHAEDLVSTLAGLPAELPAREYIVLLKSVPDSMVFPLYTWIRKESKQKPDLLVCLATHRRLLASQEWGRLERLVDDMRQHQLPLDVKYYCRIMKEASGAGRLDVCEKWFRMMKEFGCQPDRIVYNTLIHAYLKKKMHEKVFSTFQEMLGSGISPDLFTFCHLLSSCRDTRDVTGAARLFTELKSSAIPRNHVPSSILLDLYGKFGMTAEAAALFKSMQEEGLHPDATAYNTMLHAFAKEGMVDEATSVFQDFCRSGCGPDKIVFWTMLRMYCKTNHPGKAAELMATMRQRGLPVSEDCYSAVMMAYINTEQWEDAVHHMKDWQISGCPISVKSYTLMLYVLFRSGQHLACERLFRRMISKKGYRNHLPAYETMIRIYYKTNRPRQAMSIYNLMKENGCTPNSNVLRFLLSLNVSAGDQPMVNMLRQEMKGSEVESMETLNVSE